MGQGVLWRALCWTLLVCGLVDADVNPFHNNKDARKGKFGSYTRQSYLSDGSFDGPVANVLVNRGSTSPSKYIGWAPQDPQLPGRLRKPMLIDAHTFATVWAGPEMDELSLAPSIQFCNESNYLTWWSGSFNKENGANNGTFHVANNRYQILYNISALPPLPPNADCHDIYLTSTCTAVITASDISHDFSKAPGSDGGIRASAFQEIDLATGKLLFHWSSADHTLDIASETQPFLRQIKGAQDYFNIDSVEKDRAGNYLVSSRQTSTLYYISGKDGSILWRLGGSKSDFKDVSSGDATNFQYQQDARWLDHEQSWLSLFDNQASRPRGMILHLDQEKKEAKLMKSYPATAKKGAERAGSMQVLADSPSPNNVILGKESGWTEFSEDGKILVDVDLISSTSGSTDSFRVIKTNWTAFPHWSPKIVRGPGMQDHIFDAQTSTFRLRTTDNLVNDTAYVSWNGATEIAQWIVLRSDTPYIRVSTDHLHLVVNKTGFEDHAYIGEGDLYVAAVALTVHGEVLGSTSVLRMSTGSLMDTLTVYSDTDFGQLIGEWGNRTANASSNAVGAKQGFPSFVHGGGRSYRPTWDPSYSLLGVVGVCILLVVEGWYSRSRRWKRRSALVRSPEKPVWDAKSV